MKPRLARCVEGRGLTLIRRLFDGAPPGCINLGLGQPTDPLPQAAREALSAALAVGRVPYTATAGLEELRRLVGERLHDGAPAESVLITAGSQQALWIALMGLVNPGDEVLFAEPAYPAYRSVTEMIGARPVALPTTHEERWSLDPERVSAAFTERTRALVIASPSNPTGLGAGDDAQLARLHEICAEHEAWLIADEIYRPLAHAPLHAPLAQLGPRVISISGISKAFSATGLRVGWLHADPAVIEGLLPLHQQVAICAPTLGQHAALACLGLWGEELVQELRERYAPRRLAALEGLAAIPGLRFHPPEGAFYVFADFRAHADDGFALALRLRDEQHVITAPGEAFGEAGRGCLRISFVDEPERIREGLERIRRALA